MASTPTYHIVSKEPPSSLRAYWDAIKSKDEKAIAEAEQALPPELLKKITQGKTLEEYRDDCKWYFKEIPDGDRVRVALLNGHHWAATALFQRFFRSEKDNGDYHGLFNAALCSAHEGVIRSLVDTGFKPQACSRWLEAPELACRHGKLELLKWVCEQEPYKGQRAFASQVKGQLGRRELVHVAAGSGNLGVLRYVIEDLGADPKTLDSQGENALFYAARSGKVSTVSYLLERGLSVDVRSSKQSTPMHAAAKGGSVDVLRFLRGEGARVLVRDHLGLTPLHEVAHSCAEQKDLEGTVDYLIGQGISPTNRHLFQDYKSPLEWVSYYGSHEIFNVVLQRAKEEYNPSVIGWNWQRSIDGALKHAVFNSDPIKTKALLDLKANPNHETQHGGLLHTCTHPVSVWWMESRRMAVLKLLLEAGADVNQGREKHWTPVQMAVGWGAYEAVWVLIDAGADTTILDKDGRNLVQMAEKAAWKSEQVEELKRRLAEDRV